MKPASSIRQCHGHPVRSRFLQAAALMLAAALAALLSSCLSDGPSTETGNPNLEGTLRDAQGNPSAGRVKLFRVAVPAPSDTVDLSALVPPTLLATVAVGSDGRFRFDSLASAQYALEGIDAAGAKYALAPGLRVASPEDTLKPVLILSPPGRVSGRVTRGPNALPAGVDRNAGIVVRVGGADRFAYSDTAGAYAIENVPAGVYRIAFAAPDGHYEPAFRDSVRVASGANVILPDVELAWSRFQPPPSPAGLTISIDSAAGVARLAWRPVKVANLARYEVIRVDSLDAAHPAVFPAADTVFTDTLKGLPEGRRLSYRVAAVNSLGNLSDTAWAPIHTVTVPLPSVPGSGSLSGIVLSGSAPLAGARVRLHPTPSSPGSPDSLPKPVGTVDSALTGPDGRYAFTGLAMGAYTVTASAAQLAAIRIGLKPRNSGPEDTLRLAAPGSVSGFATRDDNWVSSTLKGDAGIRVCLAGAPFAGMTNFLNSSRGMSFLLTGVPAGEYKLVVHADPEGYFLPDTLDIRIEPGAALALKDTVKARYNPSAPPPKIADLRIMGSTQATVTLGWSAIRKYDLLKGYRVLRLDAQSRETARSEILTGTSYTDDLTGIASGTRIYYVVRVVSQSGTEGANGGDASGNPVGIMVP